MRENQYLIFDIETVALPFDGFDDGQQEYLLRGTSTPEEQTKKKAEMALSPLTSQVVCIGIQHMKYENDTWEVLKKSALSLDPALEDGFKKSEQLPSGSDIHYYSEKTLLEKFWQGLSKNDGIHLVSFNGRNFDAPFLMMRSAVLRVKPARNLMQGTKFNYSKHTDLLDELCFFTPQQSGATRRYNFDFFAKAFGIVSPKGEGIDGSKVGDFFKEGKYGDIAEYCLRDVSATWELFRVWDEYLRF